MRKIIESKYREIIEREKKRKNNKNSRDLVVMEY